MSDYIYLQHPLKGRRPFVRQHAKNLLKSEETNPSGWTISDDQTSTFKKVAEVTNQIQTDGADKRSDSNTSEGESKVKQKSNSRSKKSRK